MDRRSVVKGGAALGAGLFAPSTARAALASNELYPDLLFTRPYIDKDEWRDAPVRHRYVHGGFADTQLRFSFYFPPPDRYRGRFFHPVMHIAGDENVAPKGRLAGIDGDSIPFAAASGAYLVESNQGSFLMHGEVDINAFRASAATAQYSRVLAAQMYGPHRPFGYIYGGSGGAYKTFACVENTHGVWDGAVPFISGSPVSLPNVFTVQAHALRLLEGKFEAIVDAVDAGGSGDIYAGLNAEQQAALREVTRMGMPPRAWFAHKQLAFSYSAILASVGGNVFKEDPGYFADFWKVPGYLGANPPQSLRDARVQHRTTITGLMTTAEARRRGLPVGIAAGTRETAPAGIRVASLPRGKRLQGTYLFPRTGSGAGQRLMVADVIGDIVMLGYDGTNIPALEAMKPGDAVELDNSDYLALQTYHRHQNPPDEFYVWRQFRGADGKPLYPQRPLIKGYDQAGPGNNFQTGKFDCKMIHVNSMMDEAAYPWQADWYRSRAKAVLGERFEDNYRIWLTDNAMHVNPSRYLSPTEGEPHKPHHSPADTRVISYAGILQQALRDVAAWAEKGVAPPAETGYRVEDGQLHLPLAAAQRRGVQPVVTLTANGAARAEVRAGEAVELAGTIEAPEGGGGIVSAEWDYDGSGAYADTDRFDGKSATRAVRRSHTFDKPGTHFVALRVTAQREDALGTPFGQMHNLARARVVVR